MKKTVLTVALLLLAGSAQATDLLRCLNVDGREILLTDEICSVAPKLRRAHVRSTKIEPALEGCYSYDAKKDRVITNWYASGTVYAYDMKRFSYIGPRRMYMSITRVDE